MRVLMLSDGETRGGASTAAARAALGLCRLGHEVLRVVRFPDPGPHPWRTEVLETPAALVTDWEAPSRPEAKALVRDMLTAVLRRFRPQAVSVHNLHGATRHGWSVDLVATCAEVAPTVWTLHDLWSCTGRCAYTDGCERHLTGCGEDCPSWRVYPACPPGEIAARQREKRGVPARFPDLTAAAPSVWLARTARKGLWAGHRVEALANGLDLDVFRPVERGEARRALGLEPGGRVLLAASLLLDDPRKGGDLLLRALDFLDEPVTLLLMGGGSLTMANPKVAARPLGLVTDDAVKTLVFSAADVLLHPAREDNLPNTVAEALACGTPVAGFAVGGVTEMLAEGAGSVAGALTPEALALAVREVLARDPAEARERCRFLAERRYDLLGQARALARLFEETAEARADQARRAARQ